PNSALALTLIGTALIALCCRTISQSWHFYAALLGSIAIALGTTALVGYAAGVPGAYGWAHFNRMSVHTAFGFILLGGGVVGLAWNAAQAEASELPPWLPTLALVAVSTVTLSMWYALGAETMVGNLTLVAGLLSAMLVSWSLQVDQTSRRRARSLAGSTQALTQQSHAREKAEETLHQLAAIVEYSNDAIIATNLDGTILTWNTAAERLYGYTEEQVRGSHISILHARKQSGSEIFQRIVRGERIEELETVNLTSEGRRIEVSVTVSPMLDRAGHVIGASTIARDITEKKQLEQMKDDFVATVSHELRTPLTAIKGFLELVVDGDAGPLTAEQLEFLQIASRNTDRLGQLINDLLDVNQIDSQRLEIHTGPVDLAAVLKDVAGTFRPAAEAKGLEFKFQVDRLPRLQGSAPRLVQVFGNLVSNAIKYTPSGEIGIRARAARN
ncbi:MAG TPA: PAS domain S-box protein, partial [Gemmatimonadales bacterium]